MATRRSFISGLAAAFAATIGTQGIRSEPESGQLCARRPKRPARLDPRENQQKLLLDWYTAAKEMENSDHRVGLSGKPKEVFQSILPDEVRAEGIHFTFLKYLADAEVEQLGLVDVGNLENIKMNIANETADKMLESIEPIAKRIAARISEHERLVLRRR